MGVESNEYVLALHSHQGVQGVLQTAYFLGEFVVLVS